MQICVCKYIFFSSLPRVIAKALGKDGSFAECLFVWHSAKSPLQVKRPSPLLYFAECLLAHGKSFAKCNLAFADDSGSVLSLQMVSAEWMLPMVRGQ